MLFFGIAQKNLETMNRPKLSKKRPALKNKVREKELEQKRIVFRKAYALFRETSLNRSQALDIALEGYAFKKKGFQCAWSFYEANWL